MRRYSYIRLFLNGIIILQIALISPLLKAISNSNSTSFPKNKINLSKPTAFSKRLNIEKPKVVIIIDDVGTEMTHFTELMKLSEKLTVSILPGEKFSKICAEVAHQKGFEVMLHQPMQPKNNSDNHIGSGGIFVSMKPVIIEKILAENVSNIPYIKGVNNHMGSYATTKQDVMKATMKVLKEKNLYFVDSITSGNSKGYKIAKEMGVKALKRDIFIDTQSGYDYAVRQLKELRKLAKTKSVSVAIGHCRPDTIRALKNTLSEFEKDGIQISRVSEVFQE